VWGGTKRRERGRLKEKEKKKKRRKKKRKGKESYHYIIATNFFFSYVAFSKEPFSLSCYLVMVKCIKKKRVNGRTFLL